MSDLPPIRKESGPAGGRYVVTVDGKDSELTYRVTGPSRIVADHTGVPDALRGRGIALELVKALVADAQAEGLTIVPACSYVRAQAKRHPEWSDVFV
ncbi:MAG: GNAT family N-acetyltransferase [Paracoccaceae bacterium]